MTRRRTVIAIAVFAALLAAPRAHAHAQPRYQLNLRHQTKDATSIIGAHSLDKKLYHDGRLLLGGAIKGILKIPSKLNFQDCLMA